MSALTGTNRQSFEEDITYRFIFSQSHIIKYLYISQIQMHSFQFIIITHQYVPGAPIGEARREGKSLVTEKV